MYRLLEAIGKIANYNIGYKQLKTATMKAREIVKQWKSINRAYSYVKSNDSFGDGFYVKLNKNDIYLMLMTTDGENEFDVQIVQKGFNKFIYFN